MGGVEKRSVGASERDEFLRAAWRSLVAKEIHAGPTADPMMYAGAVLNGGPANEYESIEEAFAALAEDRARDAQPELGSVPRLAKASVAAAAECRQFPSWRPPRG